MPNFAQKDPKFRKRYGFFLLSGFMRPVAAWSYGMWGNAFVIVPRDYQWIIGVLTPILREFWVWLLLEVTYRAAGSRDNTATKLTCIHYMASR